MFQPFFLQVGAIVNESQQVDLGRTAAPVYMQRSVDQPVKDNIMLTGVVEQDIELQLQHQYDLRRLYLQQVRSYAVCRLAVAQCLTADTLVECSHTTCSPDIRGYSNNR